MAFGLLNGYSGMKVGIVSVFPSECKHVKVSGVASYTKNLVASLLSDCEVVVLADKTSHTNDEYQGGTIDRCWSKGILYPFQIFRKLSSHKPDITHIQHEFFLYGGMFSAVLFPILLMMLRFLRKPIVVTIHGVISLSDVNEEFKEENGLNGPLPLLKLGLVIVTKLIVSLSNAIIVHERFFVRILCNEYKCPSWKIYIIPHGVERVTNEIAQGRSKNRLGLENKVIIFFFGYIAKYKGIETLIEAFGQLAKKHKDWLLVIGGGKHPRLKLNSRYEGYVTKLQHMAQSLAPEQIVFTGFISDEDMPFYLSAADIVVLPYTTAMSSSGPLMLSIGYGKPVIASDIPPIRELIQQEYALFQKNSSEELARKLEIVLNDYNLRCRIAEEVQRIRERRLWSEVGLQTRLLYQKISSSNLQRTAGNAQLSSL